MAAETYDVIVVGLGIMGASTTYHCAKRKMRVLGLEQFDIPHEMGSSHGSSRVIRLAYFEDPRYIPLVHRAYQLWNELERTSNERLVVITGGLDIGTPEDPAIVGVQDGLRQNRIPFNVMTNEQIRKSYPAIEPPEGQIGVFQADTGFLIAERCTVSYVQAALQLGARCQAREAVTGWRVDGDGVEVTTDRGVYHAKRLVITAGPWLGQVVSELGETLAVERQVQAWFQPLKPAMFEVGRMPVFVHHIEGAAYYGLPRFGRPGVKVCRHHDGQIVSPTSVDRTPSRADETDIRSYLARVLPQANGPLMAMKVCLYTNTPDYHFILDRHPSHDNVFIAGGFSGHGFKFGSVVGEVMADMVEKGATQHPIDLFAISRFGK